MKQTSSISARMTVNQEHKAHLRRQNLGLIETFLRGALVKQDIVIAGLLRFIRLHIAPNGGI